MTRLLFIILCFVALQSQAQDGWYIKTLASPTIDYRILASDGTQTSDDIITARNQREEPAIRYRIGCLVQREVSSSLRIETGVIYSSRGWKYTYGGIYENDIDPSGGFGNNPPSIDGTASARFKYLEIPFHVVRTAGRKNLKYSYGIGVSADVLVNSPNDIEYKQINLSPIALTGVLYTINSKQAVGSNLFFRSGVLSLTEAPISGYLWTTGIQFHYLWKIN